MKLRIYHFKLYFLKKIRTSFIWGAVIKIMREIKFRAFWRDTLKPIPDFNDEYLIDACNDDLFIVQQFIGKHDINGKEIYEGDILKYLQPYSNKWYSHIVKWDEKFAGFGLFEKDNEWCKESDWLKIQSIEITGNFYEKI